MWVSNHTATATAGLTRNANRELHRRRPQPNTATTTAGLTQNANRVPHRRRPQPYTATATAGLTRTAYRVPHRRGPNHTSPQQQQDYPVPHTAYRTSVGGSSLLLFDRRL